MAGRGNVGPVEVEVHRRIGDGGRPAMGRVDLHFDGRCGCIVRDVDLQVIARLHMERRVFEAVGCHEAEQRPTVEIRRRLVREIDRQHAAAAEESRWVLDDASGSQAGTGVGHRSHGIFLPGRRGSRPCRGLKDRHHGGSKYASGRNRNAIHRETSLRSAFLSGVTV